MSCAASASIAAECRETPVHCYRTSSCRVFPPFPAGARRGNAASDGTRALERSQETRASCARLLWPCGRRLPAGAQTSGDAKLGDVRLIVPTPSTARPDRWGACSRPILERYRRHERERRQPAGMAASPGWTRSPRRRRWPYAGTRREHAESCRPRCSSARAPTTCSGTSTGSASSAPTQRDDRRRRRAGDPSCVDRVGRTQRRPLRYATPGLGRPRTSPANSCARPRASTWCTKRSRW